MIERSNRPGRYSARLPDGTELVSSSRQPLLDSARVLINWGYLPETRVEMWRPGASQFAMRAVLGVAARLTVDETRTIFVPWKPFSSSAMASPARSGAGAATTLATSLAASTYDPPDNPELLVERRHPRTHKPRAISPADGTAAHTTDASNKTVSNQPVQEETTSGA